MSRAALLRGVGSAIALGAVLVLAMPESAARAETLEQLLREGVEGNDRVISAQAESEAARNRAREALGAWFPSLTPTFNFGWEQQNKPTGTADTSTGFREFDLKLSQLLWDFGATNAAVEKARLRLLQAEITLVGARQELMQEMAQAYVNLLRAEQVLAYSRQSERNIQRQTGLEEARVEAGSGLSTDVLQAKTQLAGAEARRIQAEGSLVSAVNRFRAVFGRAPPPVSALDPVILQESRLPPDLDAAVRIADESNIQLLQANLTEAIAREDVSETRSREFFPKVEGVLSQAYKRNVAGTLDSQNETLAKVELSMPINLGGTQFNKLRAAQSTLLARVRTVSDTRRRVEEQVRNAWDQLKTARATASSRRNQASIADAFLELARKERQLGQRSLIDVLSGETNLINAQSDAASAEADVLIAAFGLLKTLGRLDYDTFRAMPAVPVPSDTAPDSAVPPETTERTPQPRISVEGRVRIAIAQSASSAEGAPAGSVVPIRALPPRPYAAPESDTLPAPAAETLAEIPAPDARHVTPPPPELDSAPMPSAPDTGVSGSTSLVTNVSVPQSTAEAAAPSDGPITAVVRGVENAFSSLLSALMESGRAVGDETRRGRASASVAHNGPKGTISKATILLPPPESVEVPAGRANESQLAPPAPPAVPLADGQIAPTPAATDAPTRNARATVSLPATTSAEIRADRGSEDRPSRSVRDDGNRSDPGNPVSRFFRTLFAGGTTSEQTAHRTSASTTRPKATILLPATASIEIPVGRTTESRPSPPAQVDAYRPDPNDPLARFVRALFADGTASEATARQPSPPPTAPPPEPQVALTSAVMGADREMADRDSGSPSPSNREHGYRPDPQDPVARFFRALFGGDESREPVVTQPAASPTSPLPQRRIAPPPPNAKPGIDAPVQPPVLETAEAPYRPDPNDPLLRLFRALAGRPDPVPAAGAITADQAPTEQADPVSRFFSQVITVFAQGSTAPKPASAGR